MSVHNDFFVGAVDPTAQEGANDHNDHGRVSGTSTSTGLDSPQGIIGPGTTSAPSTATDLDWSDSLLFGADIDGQDVISPQFHSAFPGFEPHQDLNLTFQPQTVDYSNSAFPLSLPVEQPASGLEHASYQEAMEEFFAKNGAWRPPEPCNHCRRLRLQCFMLQTTDANPNPVNSCSSCVALFRNCSLAERSKRGHSQFETSRPVIGHLHGVNEEENQLTWDQFSQPTAGQPSGTVPMPSITSKRSSSRSVRKTQILRDWFAVNIQHPYPTDDEKTTLAEQSGLSRTQVINWFTNARRRHRLSTQPMVNNATFRAGSPMPRSLLSSMTPFERWKHSPPDSEPVSEAAIQEAISFSANKHEGSVPGDADDLGSSASTDSMLYSRSALHYSSDGSLSNYSHASGNSDAVHSGRSSEDRSHPAWVKSASARSKRSKARTFICSYCSRSFNKKYDWLRHERSVHAPGDTSWVCAIPLPPEQSYIIWRLGQTQAECIFCGQASPTEEHFQSHEFESCAKRAVQDRSFTRKDHMWQHLYKFHGCRKWEGWKPDVNLLMHKSGGA
ncbi:homeobox and C2H2 transcription factor [Pochonia chlamydosporia 170]|uniref:Homeobox and C2H2 transcription factor n=1 Tax=Pochonia chlamydosporia 170 TaxID=1380566 RepID=A0A179FSG2_METCM|nr:homeobox and C2H2 transcription factor [Pochonia chlamydosporia 170]OAQ68576.1 homeobox and C2H2 transcription factor [Pochonia chlamydosporia 170]